MLGGAAKKTKILAIGAGAVGTIAGFGACHLAHHLMDTPVVLPKGVQVEEVPFFTRSSSYRFMDYIFSSKHEYVFTKIKSKDMQVTQVYLYCPFLQVFLKMLFFVIHFMF